MGVDSQVPFEREGITKVLGSVIVARANMGAPIMTKGVWVLLVMAMLVVTGNVAIMLQ